MTAEAKFRAQGPIATRLSTWAQSHSSRQQSPANGDASLRFIPAIERTIG